MTGKAERDASPLAVDDDGIVRAARFVASPNCDERPADAAIELLIIHSISLPPGEFGGSGIEDLFQNRLDPAAHPYYARIADLRVSSHFLIRRDGAMTQFVPCMKRAWHAGESTWRGRPRCNDYSVGIELEGVENGAFEDAQYATLARLAGGLLERYPIVDAVAHSEVAPGRKTDPGPAFDWTRFRASIPPLPR